MAEDDNLQYLTNARRVLVEIRYNWIKAIAAGYESGKTQEAIKGLIDVQQAIEVVDSTADELEEADL
ncbi:MAG: hypothetical protein ACRECL_08540 [Bradyrhizobium sp.]